MHIDWTYNREYTDKFRENKDTGHFFVDVYKDVLPTSKSILEVGTQQGGFVKFCKDQMDDIFFVGADLYTAPKYGANYWVDDKNFNDMSDDFFVGDAFTQDFLIWLESKGYLNRFDLVIDDGPHTLESQVWLIQQSHRLLNYNGVYICEDVQNLQNAEIIASCSPFPDTTTIWDNSQKSGRWDDICVIVNNRK